MKPRGGDLSEISQLAPTDMILDVSSPIKFVALYIH